MIRVLLGRPVIFEKEYRSEWERLQSQAVDVLSKMSLGISIKGTQFSRSERQDIVDAVRRNIEQSGLNVETSKRCRKSLSHHALITPSNRCKRGSFGFLCTIEI